MGDLHSRVAPRGKREATGTTPGRKGDHIFFFWRDHLRTLACWDLKSRPGLGAGIGARDWDLQSVRKKGVCYPNELTRNSWGNSHVVTVDLVVYWQLYSLNFLTLHKVTFFGLDNGQLGSLGLSS